MPDSIQEQIIKAMAAALAEITTAGGYDNTVNSVQRRQWDGMNLGAMPTVMIREGECAVDLTKSTHDRVRRRLDVDLILAVPPDAPGGRSGAEVLNNLIADIEKRIGFSQRWGGLALMTEPPIYFEEGVDAETPHLSRGLRVTIDFEHLRTDPRAQ